MTVICGDNIKSCVLVFIEFPCDTALSVSCVRRFADAFVIWFTGVMILCELVQPILA